MTVLASEVRPSDFVFSSFRKMEKEKWKTLGYNKDRRKYGVAIKVTIPPPKKKGGTDA